MRQDVFDPVAFGHVRWLTPGEGGRSHPPDGPVYAATAVAASDPRTAASLPTAAHLSVLLKYLEKPSTRVRRSVGIDFLARDLAARAFHPGTPFIVMEGRRPVAEGVVDRLA
jgi:hypothetical protein